MGFASYTLVDIPECLQLAKKCLQKQDVKNVNFVESNQLDPNQQLKDSEVWELGYVRLLVKSKNLIVHTLDGETFEIVMYNNEWLSDLIRKIDHQLREKGICFTDMKLILQNGQEIYSLHSKNKAIYHFDKYTKYTRVVQVKDLWQNPEITVVNDI